MLFAAVHESGVGKFRTWQPFLMVTVIEGKADLPAGHSDFRV
jgi:hypothetical protein